MDIKKSAKKSARSPANPVEKDTQADAAREFVSKMEPLVLSQTSRHRPELADLALRLSQSSAELRSSLPRSLVLRWPNSCAQ
jgi:hypothetical protein